MNTWARPFSESGSEQLRWSRPCYLKNKLTEYCPSGARPWGRSHNSQVSLACAWTARGERKAAWTSRSPSLFHGRHDDEAARNGGGGWSLRLPGESGPRTSLCGDPAPSTWPQTMRRWWGRRGVNSGNRTPTHRKPGGVGAQGRWSPRWSAQLRQRGPRGGCSSLSSRAAGVCLGAPATTRSGGPEIWTRKITYSWKRSPSSSFTAASNSSTASWTSSAKGCRHCRIIASPTRPSLV